MTMIRRVLQNQPVTTFILFMIMTGIQSLPFFQGIRMFFLLYFAVAVTLSLYLRSAFQGFFLTFLVSLQIFTPNKNYEVEVIPGKEILEPAFNYGYYTGYYFTLGTFLSLFALIFLIKEAVGVILQQKLRHLLFLLILPWTIFIFFGTYSSSLFSPYPLLSYIWLYQYSLLLLVAISYLIGVSKYKTFNQLFFATLGVIIATQSVVSILQFIVQKSFGFSYEVYSSGTFATGLDENNAVYRVMGTFTHPNQLAIILTLLVAVTLPYALRYRQLYLTGISTLGLVVILLTQSRSVIFGLLLVILLNSWMYRDYLRSLVKVIGTKRLAFYALVVILLASFSIIPRLLLIFNSGYEGAGLSLRIKMFREAYEALLLNPWFGYGIDTNEYVLHRLFPYGYTSLFPAAVHMAYLQLALEVGVLGLIAFLFPFIFFLRWTSINTLLKHSPLTYRSIGFIGGVTVILLFWSLLPHIGIIEFPFYGLILGVGSYQYYLGKTS
jgi:O-antigen ligase